MIFQNEPEDEIHDRSETLTPWAHMVLDLLRPLSRNQKGTFRETVSEWIVWDMEDNGSNSARWGTCSICHNDGIRYAYVIKNRYTDHCIGSVGSICIHEFMENANLEIKAANEKVRTRTRLKWLEEIQDLSLSSGKFTKSIDKYFEQNSAITPSQLLALIKIGDSNKIPLPFGVYPVKLRRDKDKSQFKGLKPEDTKRIWPHLTPSQQTRYSRMITR